MFIMHCNDIYNCYLISRPKKSTLLRNEPSDIKIKNTNNDDKCFTPSLRPTYPPPPRNSISTLKCEFFTSNNIA